MTTPADHDRHVAAGIEFLNEREHVTVPANWRQRIDLERLSIASGFDCVLGQLFGTYDEACTMLDLSYDRAVELGFTAASVTQYSPVTEAWLRALAPQEG